MSKCLTELYLLTLIPLVTMRKKPTATWWDKGGEMA